jgi:2-hydroxychromene-2-carboxylate isomerase
MPELKFFYSPASRYSYLALTQVPAIEREFGVSFEWIPNVGGRIRELRGADPFAGPPLSGQYDWAYRQKDAEAWARYYGVPYQEPRSVEFDSPLLGAAAVAALHFDRGHSYSCELAAEVFARGSWPLDHQLCVRLAAEHGIDSDVFEIALAAPETAEQLEANCRLAHELGVFGNPTFMVAGDMFWGQDRLPLVRQALDALGVTP